MVCLMSSSAGGEVEAADDGGHLVDAGDLPGVLDHVDDARVGAGADDHQAPAGHVQDQGLLVGEGVLFLLFLDDP